MFDIFGKKFRKVNDSIKKLQDTISSRDKRIAQIEKTNNNLMILAQDCQDRINELTEERDNYKEVADNLLKMLTDPLPYAMVEDNTQMYRNGFPSFSGVGGVGRHADGSVDKFEENHDRIEPIGLLTCSFNDKPDRSLKINPRKSVVEWLGTHNYTEQEQVKRFEEAEQFRIFVENNYPLTIKAISNKNRIQAERDGVVPNTNTSKMKPYEIIEFVDKLPIVPINKWSKDLPSNVKKVVVKYYDNHRTKFELYDDEGKLLNPSVEDGLWQRLLCWFNGCDIPVWS